MVDRQPPALPMPNWRFLPSCGNAGTPRGRRTASTRIGTSIFAADSPTSAFGARPAWSLCPCRAFPSSTGPVRGSSTWIGSSSAPSLVGETPSSCNPRVGARKLVNRLNHEGVIERTSGANAVREPLLAEAVGVRQGACRGRVPVVGGSLPKRRALVLQIARRRRAGRPGPSQTVRPGVVIGMHQVGCV